VADWPEPQPEPPAGADDPRFGGANDNGRAPKRAAAGGRRDSSSDSAPASAERYSPDDAASVDDEDVVTSAASGRAVIEKVLGGQFLGELED
jgi:hypothetical protein